MKSDTLPELPPLPSHDEHFMTCAHVYTADQMHAYALQARAQVQGEVCPTCGETEPYTGSCGTSNNDTKALCKQPLRATQPAQMLGELSVDQMREMLSVHKLAIVPMRATHAMLDAMSDDDWQWSDLLAAAKAITESEYDWIDATPQPAQATKAELTDEEIEALFGKCGGHWSGDQGVIEEADLHLFARAILALRPEPVPVPMTDGIRPEDFIVDVVVKPMGGFAPVNTQGVRVTHNPTGISVTCDVARSQHMNRQQAFEKLRAILALRHGRVPMTDEQRRLAFLASRAGHGHTAFMLGISASEVHHGITAQSKKETT